LRISFASSSTAINAIYRLSLTEKRIEIENFGGKAERIDHLTARENRDAGISIEIAPGSTLFPSVSLS
jgi:hypothetical protein